MGEHDFWKIDAIWQKREETPRALGRRILTFAEYLANADTIVRNWFYWETDDVCLNVKHEPERLTREISERVSRDEYGTAEPHYGYHFQMNNTPSDVADPSTFMFRFLAGSRVGFNSIDIDTPFGIEPTPELLQYSVFKALVLATAEAFEPDFVSVRPTTLPSSIDFDTKTYARIPPISSGWMVYLAPALAANAQVPSLLTGQTCGDGGLFLTVTDQTFDAQNIAHRQGALMMEEMLDPLNGVTPGGMR